MQSLPLRSRGAALCTLKTNHERKTTVIRRRYFISVLEIARRHPQLFAALRFKFNPGAQAS